MTSWIRLYENHSSTFALAVPNGMLIAVRAGDAMATSFVPMPSFDVACQWIKRNMAEGMHDFLVPAVWLPVDPPHLV